MVLRRAKYHVDTFSEPARALEALAEQPYDAMITDLRMPDMDGVEVLQKARELQPGLPVVLLTAYATVQTAVDAMKSGAFDYLQKPLDNDACRRVIERAVSHHMLNRENSYLRGQVPAEDALSDVVAESPAMKRAFELARRAARSSAPVLISGESGTGKEVVARAVHFYSARVGKPFEAVNLKAFASGVLESELFGHERGAFTGANRARAGIFERAAGGTVLLDEVGEADLDLQAKLLRVLQEKEVRRVGGDGDRRVDARVIAATNRDLQEEVRAGRFREDLYFRLAVIPIHLAPLRERREDILPLATAFLKRINERDGLDIIGWDADVEAYLLSHDWPGNVRELANSMERGAAMSQTPRIAYDDLLLSPGAAKPARGDTLQDAVDAATADAIAGALAAAGGRKADAAERLGVERTTLYRLMKRLELE